MQAKRVEWPQKLGKFHLPGWKIHEKQFTTVFKLDGNNKYYLVWNIWKLFWVKNAKFFDVEKNKKTKIIAIKNTYKYVNTNLV